MFSQIKFTFTESLLVATLIPCIFLILYLISAIKNKSLALIPVLYFTSLSTGLIYRLMPVFTINIHEQAYFAFSLIILDCALPALSFLLIIQLAFNKVPSPVSWGILAIPAIATTPFIYAYLNNPLVCISDMDVCFPSSYALHLNISIFSSFIFILLTVILARRAPKITGNKLIRKHKYWLIMCLIIYNLILIAIEMGIAAELVSTEQYIFAKALIKIALIYLIMTSIFRVFNDLFEITPAGETTVTNKIVPLTEYELSVAARAEKILNTEYAYRESGFNRASFAKKLGVREHVLSRIINMHFHKSFSELANEYRLREAKELLATTDLSITDIAYNVGFSSITSFNRVFKEITEQSPSEFRASNNKPATHTGGTTIGNI